MQNANSQQRQTSTIATPPGVNGRPLDTSPIRPELIVTASLCLFLTISAIGARVFTKTVIDHKRVQLEDYALIFAGVFFISFVGVLYAAGSAGQGAHLWDVSENSLKRVLVLSNILAILYAPIILSTKVSLLLQMSSLFSKLRQSFLHYAVPALIATNTLGYATIFFLYVFACIPRAKISDPSLGGHCVSKNGSIITTGAIDLSSNVTLLILPFGAFYVQQLSTNVILAISGVLSIGGLACVASAMRLFYDLRAQQEQDLTEAIWPGEMWALAELTCIILIACCTAFPRLAAYIWHPREKNNPYTASHAIWTSGTTILYGSAPANVSKTRFCYPAQPEGPVSNSPSQHDIPSLGSSETGALRRPDELHLPAAIPLEPIQRSRSHLSHRSYYTPTITETLEEDPPVSPLSYATSNWTVSQLDNATTMSVTTVQLTSIKRTIDVRVSTHTNPGSPIGGGKPQW